MVARKTGSIINNGSISGLIVNRRNGTRLTASSKRRSNH